MKKGKPSLQGLKRMVRLCDEIDRLVKEKKRIGFFKSTVSMKGNDEVRLQVVQRRKERLLLGRLSSNLKRRVLSQQKGGRRPSRGNSREHGLGISYLSPDMWLH